MIDIAKYKDSRDLVLCSGDRIVVIPYKLRYNDRLMDKVETYLPNRSYSLTFITRGINNVLKGGDFYDI